MGKKPRNFIKELPYNSTIYVIFLTLSKTASLYSKAKRTASRIIDVRKSSYEYWSLCKEVTYDLLNLALSAQYKQVKCLYVSLA